MNSIKYGRLGADQRTDKGARVRMAKMLHFKTSRFELSYFLIDSVVFTLGEIQISEDGKYDQPRESPP